MPAVLVRKGDTPTRVVATIDCYFGDNPLGSWLKKQHLLQKYFHRSKQNENERSREYSHNEIKCLGPWMGVNSYEKWQAEQWNENDDEKCTAKARTELRYEM